MVGAFELLAPLPRPRRVALLRQRRAAPQRCRVRERGAAGRDREALSVDGVPSGSASRYAPSAMTIASAPRTWRASTTAPCSCVLAAPDGSFGHSASRIRVLRDRRAALDEQEAHEPRAPPGASTPPASLPRLTSKPPNRRISSGGVTRVPAASSRARRRPGPGRRTAPSSRSAPTGAGGADGGRGRRAHRGDRTGHSSTSTSPSKAAATSATVVGVDLAALQRVPDRLAQVAPLGADHVGAAAECPAHVGDPVLLVAAGGDGELGPLRVQAGETVRAARLTERVRRARGCVSSITISPRSSPSTGRRRARRGSAGTAARTRRRAARARRRSRAPERSPAAAATSARPASTQHGGQPSKPWSGSGASTGLGLGVAARERQRPAVLDGPSERQYCVPSSRSARSIIRRAWAHGAAPSYRCRPRRSRGSTPSTPGSRAARPRSRPAARAGPRGRRRHLGEHVQQRLELARELAARQREGALGELDAGRDLAVRGAVDAQPRARQQRDRPAARAARAPRASARTGSATVRSPRKYAHSMIPISAVSSSRPAA